MSLEDIRARLHAATPGPWAWEPHGDSGGWSLGVVMPSEADDHATGLSGRLEPGEGDPALCVADGGVDGSDADADFIAHAPTDIAALLAVAVAAADLMESVTYVQAWSSGKAQITIGDAARLDDLHAAVEALQHSPAPTANAASSGQTSEEDTT